jgi:ABC-2 type transport system permease protein
VRQIFIEEFRRFTRGKGYTIVTLAVPAVLLLLLAVIPVVRSIAAGKEEKEPKPIGIVVFSDNLAFSPNDMPGFLEFSTRQEGIDGLEEETVKEVFVIPEEYMETGQVEWLHGPGGAFSGFDPGPSDSSAAAIRAYLRTALASEGMAPDVLARAVAGVAFERVRIGEDGMPMEEDEGVAAGTFVVSFVSTFLLVFSIIIGASGLAQAVAEEKECHMIEVLLTSVKPLSVMAGKVLAIGAAQLVMITVWVGSVVLIVPTIFDVIPAAPELPMNLGVIAWVLAFFLAGYFMTAVFMAGMGAMTTRVQEANQLAFLVIMPLFAPINAVTVIISKPDGVVARVLSFIPFTAPTTMMVRLATEGSSILESLASLAVVVLTGVASLWVSARVFRAGLLMYGQRMSLRRVMSALREAG